MAIGQVRLPKVNKTFLRKVFGIESPSWVNIVLWLIGVLIMIGLTVKDLKPIVDSFYNIDENTLLQIKVRNPDEVVQHAPSLHLCVPLNGSSEDFSRFSRSLADHLIVGMKCPECDALTEHSFDVWNRVESSRNVTFDAFNTSLQKAYDGYHKDDYALALKFEEILRTLFVHAILEHGPNGRVVTRSNLTWNRPLAYALISSLGREAILESRLVQQLRFGSVAGLIKDASATENSRRTQHAILESFVCEFLNLIDKAAKRFAPANLCTKYVRDRLSVQALPKSEWAVCFPVPLDIVEDLLVIIVRTSGPNYVAAEGDIRVMSDNNRMDTLNKFGDGPSYVTTEKGIRVVYESNRKGELNFDFLNFVFDETSVETPGYKMDTVTIAYSAQSTVLEARPSRMNKCYRESSKSECERRCWAQRVESICGCRLYAYPWRTLFVSTRTNASNEEEGARSYCAINDPDRCLAKLTTVRNTSGTLINDTCSTDCSYGCHFTAYQSQVRSTVAVDNGTFDLLVHFVLKRQTYSEFTMRVLDSQSDFVSKIGGVFNFYLGWSVVSLIFFFVYLFDSARRFVSLKAEEATGDSSGSSGSDREITELGWRMRWVHSNASTAAAAGARSTKETIEYSRGISELRQELGSKVEKAELDEKLESIDRKIDSLSSSVTKMSEAVQGLVAARRKHAAAVPKRRVQQAKV